MILPGAADGGWLFRHPGKFPGEREMENTIKSEKSRAGPDTVILVVESNADVRYYIKEALEPDWKVIEAVSGEEGIEMATKIIPDLIISDTKIPGMTGDELCRVLKKNIHTSHIPIMLLAAGRTTGAGVEGFRAGADDCIRKPFSAGTLKRRVENLLFLRGILQERVQRRQQMLPAEVSLSPLDKTFIEELEAVIEMNLSHPGFDSRQLIEILGRDMKKDIPKTPVLLYRKVRALTGQSPMEFIRSYRLKRAAQLLKTNSADVPAVAAAVGFSSTGDFIRSFKETFHQLPATFQAAEAL